MTGSRASLSRRSLLQSALALPAASAVAAATRISLPPVVIPITPAEYLREMEANGLLPVTRIGRDGEPKGVFEFTVNDPPTRDDMEFLYHINCRVQKSGPDFYKRTARYLFEHGRGVPYEKFDAKDFRPGGAS